MLAKIFIKIRQQTVFLAVVAIVLLAAYVSIGRQFMPIVSQYREYFQLQLTGLTGVPVTIVSLTGSFAGFNPILQINGLSLKVGGSDDDGAVFFESATLELDVPQSIWQRQWVLKDFTVDSLEINIEQTPAGNWQLQGVNISGGESVELSTVYNALLRISRLDMAELSINFKPRNGERYRFNGGTASIRNQNAVHYIHVSAFPGQSRAAIAVSLEVVGQTLNDMVGQLHVDIPVGNYSELLADDYGEQFSLSELVGGAELWVELAQGKPRNLVLQPQVSRLAFNGPYSDGTVLQQINGNVFLEFPADDSTVFSKLALSNMHLSWNGINWLDFNSLVNWESEQAILLAADHVNLELLAGVAMASGFLNENAETQLAQYDPKGSLENLIINSALAAGDIDLVSLASNVRGGQVSSVRGSPNLAGMNGYMEFDFDADAGKITGLGEIDSTDFSMHIPNVFTSVWDYSRANGALDFQIDIKDGQEVSLHSSVIVAESDAVDAHAQFASYLRRYPDGSREAELDLYVGTTRMDGQQKYLYLPDGPNVSDSLRSSMEWVDNAVLSGDVDNAGIIYRGSTIPGAPSELKTFQSYFEMSDGEMLFSGEWPQLDELSALVFTDDNNVDVAVRSGHSLGLDLVGASGTIRRNQEDENWLSIQGLAVGSTQDGLEYLQNADVGESIKNVFSTWQAQGEFNAEVEVAIPLSQPEAGTDVRIELNIQNNDLFLPDYSLEVADVTGPVIFDTRTGVEDTQLTGVVFGREAEFTLASQQTKDELEFIFVNTKGSTTPTELIDWPLQSEFVASLLKEASGSFAYDANLVIGQGSDDSAKTALTIETALEGAGLSLPEPFAKEPSQTRPVFLDFEFGDEEIVSGSFGDDLVFQLQLEDGDINDGVVYVGKEAVDIENLLANDTSGLVILGDLPLLKVEQWSDFLNGLTAEESGSGGFSESLAFVDVSVDGFEMYGQTLNNVAMRVEPSQQIPAWTVRLVSENILGQVDIPFSDEDYLLVDLEYLRLPVDEEADAEAVIGPVPDFEEEQVDVLADIDPRSLPNMKFATDDFSIGASPYGSWQFTLDASDRGAEFTDLAFDFRGLRLGLGEETSESDEEASSPEPHFVWLFDGVEHRSELQGLLSADNMADVLTANGLAAVFESTNATFDADIQWPGSPAFFAASGLSGAIDMDIRNGRFLQNAGGNGALKLISIINFDAIMRRLRFSDDLLRRGLAYDEITAQLLLDDGEVNIQDRLVISGPSSLYQITGNLDLEQETILGELYVTLPVSRNIPWIGVLTANIPLAVGAYLFDRIFGDQVNSLTSAVYTLDGPWEGLEPQFKQAFGSPASSELN